MDGRAISLGIVAMSCAGHRVMQSLDVVDVFYVTLHKLSPGFDIVLVEFLFRRDFFEMLAQAVLHFFGKQLHDKLEVAGLQCLVASGESPGRDRGRQV